MSKELLGGLELNRIYQRDVLDGLKMIPDGSIDLIVADPPYFEIHGEFDFAWNNVDEYIQWCKQWILECQRVLKNEGAFYLWGGIGYNKGYPLFKLADWIENENIFLVQNWITQRNTRGFGSKKGYMAAREELIFMTKSDEYTWNTAYTEEKSKRKDLGANGKPRTNEFKRCSDVWIDITEASQSSVERFKTKNGKTFPTVKAQKLCHRIINASSNESDIVLIPFCGSGSECVAAKNLNRKFISFEKNHEYIEIANIRLESVYDEIVDEQLTRQ